ncbi:hypothetical protein NKH16_34030, partial [Mesorhizobium sp. M1307]|uniref:hypothetical protein n=1 Tax=Mesorhizobium sp. M1307 TaxID=2957079 RepID=UPI00333DAE2A
MSVVDDVTSARAACFRNVERRIGFISRGRCAADDCTASHLPLHGGIMMDTLDQQAALEQAARKRIKASHA